MVYRKDIDGLRAIAVLSVMMFHAFPHFLKSGFVGVDVFFVISGYLISRIIFAEISGKSFSFFDFVGRRIRRLFPALLVVLLGCLLLGWLVLFPDEYRQLGKHVFGGSFFVSNFILWEELDYFDNSSETKPLLHLWSLGVEEQFYLIWPIFILIILRFRFNLIVSLTSFLIISLAINVLLSELKSEAAFFLPFGRFWQMLTGSVIAWFFEYKKHYLTYIEASLKTTSRKLKLASHRLMTDIISLFGLILLLNCFFLDFDKSQYPGTWVLLPVFATCIIILSGDRAFVNRTVLSNKVMVWLGIISYPLYLWHWPTLSFLRIINGGELSLLVKALALLSSVIFAFITYKFIERSFRFNFDKKFSNIFLVISMLLVGGVGAIVFHKDGLNNRPAIKLFEKNQTELERIVEIDNDCKKYVDIIEPQFRFCRIKNVGASKTIAIIGDSHAHVAFSGFANNLESHGYNVLMLASSGCPLILDVGREAKSYAKAGDCVRKSKQILSAIVKDSSIKNVFIFTRGPIYWTGDEPVMDELTIRAKEQIKIEAFFQGLQSSINFLNSYSKKVYYVIENPELTFHPESCLTRPFRLKKNRCYVDYTKVISRQSEYRKNIQLLTNVIIIDSLKAFCPSLVNCKVFDEKGHLLYFDDDHVSVSGSKFQFNKIILPLIKDH